MIVAIIDDGVNDLFSSEIGELSFDLEVKDSGKIINRSLHDRYLSSHGTTCAAIIKKYAPTAEIGSIKILDESTWRGYSFQLITAIRWCTANNVSVIHTSLGSTYLTDYDKIRRAVGQAQNNGAILIAALSNSKKFTIPANLPFVIGTKYCSLLSEDQVYALEPDIFDVEFAASSRHTIVDYAGVEHTTSDCNSFAAPVLTSHVVQILDKEPGLEVNLIVNRIGGHFSTWTEKLKNTCWNRRKWTVPIVGVIGNKGTHVLMLAHCINQELIRMQYNCLSISDLPLAEKYHIECLPPYYNPEYMFASAEYYQQPDVILFATHSFQAFFDIKIVISDNFISLDIEKEEIHVPRDFRLDQIRRICCNLIQY